MKKFNILENKNFDEIEYSKLKEQFENLINSWKNLSADAKEYKTKEKKQIIKQFDGAEFIAWYLIKEKNFEKKFIFNVDPPQWYGYQIQKPYLWSICSDMDFEIYLKNDLKDIFPWDIYVTTRTKTKEHDQIIRELKQLLSCNIANITNPELMIRNNIVYNHKLRKEVNNDISYNDYIYNYSEIEYEPNAKCPQIEKWLHEVFNNDQKQIKLFKAICQVIYLSNKSFNLQFFVEIKGVGRSGKSTAGKLMQALVGAHLRASTNLHKLHTSKYETANLINKNIVIMPDQKAWIGEAEILKTLTGGDSINYEMKYKSSGNFIFHGIVVILTNDKLTYSTTESAILRRRIVFNFNKQVPAELQDDQLINIIDDKTITGKWTNELSGFANEIMKPTQAEVINTIKNHLAKSSQDVTESPFMWWVRNRLAPRKNAKIGIKHTAYGPAAYGLYYSDMISEGLTPISVNNFISTLEKDFGAAFPGYTIKYEHKPNLGRAFVDVTYQQANLPEFKQPEDQIKFLVKWRNNWKDVIDNNFFGTTDVTKDEDLLLELQAGFKKNIIFDNNDLRNHLHKLPQPQEILGFPKTNNQKNNDNQIAPPIILNSEETQIIDQEKLLKEFLNNFSYEINSKITTETIYAEYEKFSNNKNLNPFLTKLSIKNKIKNLWNSLYPDQQIEDAKNITIKKLSGLKNLKKIS